MIFEKEMQLSTSGGSFITKATGVAEAADGGYIIFGNFKGSNGYPQPFATKLASNGDSLWTRFYEFGYLSTYTANIFKNMEGNYVLAHSPGIAGKGTFASIIEINESGDTVRTKNLSMTAGQHVNKMIQTTDSGYIILVEKANSSGGPIRVNKNFDRVWELGSIMVGIDKLPVNGIWNSAYVDGNDVYYSGRNGSPLQHRAYFMKRDLLDSNRFKFYKEYGFGSSLNNFDISLLGNGHFLMPGTINTQTKPGLYTSAITLFQVNKAGDSLKLSLLDGPATDEARNVTKGTNYYLITGMFSAEDLTLGTKQEMISIGVDNDGVMKWTQTFSRNVTQAVNHYGSQTIETKDGRFVIVGYKNVEKTSHTTMYIVKFSPQSSGITVQSANLKLNYLTVYPNPFTETVAVTINSDAATSGNNKIVVLDITGRELHRQSLDTQTIHLNTEFPAGMYLLQLIHDDRIIEQHKIIKQ